MVLLFGEWRGKMMEVLLRCHGAHPVAHMRLWGGFCPRGQRPAMAITLDLCCFGLRQLQTPRCNSYTHPHSTVKSNTAAPPSGLPPLISPSKTETKTEQLKGPQAMETKLSLVI